MIVGTPKYPNRLRQTIDKCHLTVEEVAAETGIPKRTLFEYCAGRVSIPVKRLEILADYLGYPASYLVPDIENPYLVQSEKGYTDVWMQPGVINNVDTLRRRLLQQLLYAGGTMLVTSKEDLTSPDAWQRLSFALNSPYRTDDATLTHLETLTNAYWDLYRGAIAKVDLQSSVSGHLLTVTQLLQSAQPPTAQKRLCSVASNAAQILGEIYFDMNDLESADAYYELAAEAAQEVNNHALWGIALGRRGFLSVYSGKYEKALPLLQEAYVLAENSTTGKTKSWITMMKAEALSNLKSKDECLSALEQTVQIYDQDYSQTGEDRQWTGFTQSTLIGYQGICYLHLRLSNDAQSMLRKALDALQPGPTRRRAVLLTDLATSYMQQAEIEEACKIATQALSCAAQTKSARALNQLRQFQQELKPWRNLTPVRRFNDYMRIVKYT